MEVLNQSTIDLDRYFKRIHYKGDCARSLNTLFDLHLSHTQHIPFENLDILLGKSISLALPDIERKLINNKRGGYCFEHNLLFAHILNILGFPITRLAARVHYRTNKILPRTHMALLVHHDGSNWLADVGFGGHGLLLPLPLKENVETTAFGWTYRIKRIGHLWALELLQKESWSTLYSFSVEPQEEIDYKIANYYVSTHPDSPFTHTLIVQSVCPKERKILRNKVFTVQTPSSLFQKELKDDEELLEILLNEFGLSFPPNTRFTFKE
ncbi:hypothetical protein A946_00155 [Methylacidiphilum kamchatkense Kam1]|uniref:N-hydroxyarylamine O-acetyltransferase n=1 Tax=Methylacidiphilum kamchatkense Kam1 TaxID=1202785 RepID=A0A0C1UTU1_9BACT|nr:arylamine N-acetyltransferase [Methylacidiphilum kamchatkense]KIE59188.1 hypothetical protein A946_00155 [Methylacidiphilum kamchatkense Kam1]QDQ42855.1 N-hydroxyarylamine O-acetyltransferase [Methylacidiphilum kamchatkense Kam1]